LVGLCKDKDKNRITKESNPVYLTKTLSYDFGNEIDFTTFLKYTGVEVEKGEKCTCETCNPTEPKKVEKSLEDKISELTQLINKRVELNIKSDRLNDELTEINTKLSALLKWTFKK